MQLPPQAQPPEDAELLKPPEVAAANTEIRRRTSSESQVGQAGANGHGVTFWRDEALPLGKEHPSGSDRLV